jgi:hypothetical protein
LNISRQKPPVEKLAYQKQLDNVEYFNYMGWLNKNYARCKREVKSRISMVKAGLNKEEEEGKEEEESYHHQQIGIKI